MIRLVFGCGYLGKRVARLWSAAGDTVYAVTRSPQRASEFAAAGWRPIIADITHEAALSAALSTMEPPETVLFAVGFDRSSHHSIRDVYVAGLSNAIQSLARHSSSIRKFLYVSSTGVFGQTDGSWVDESSECRPTRDGGRACLEAEQRLQSSPFGDRTIILRCSGLYGPGRIPYLRQLQAGEPLAAPADGFLNLVHIDDAAAVVAHAARQLVPPELLVVSDGHPVLRCDYYATLARLLDAPAPRFIAPPANSAALARAGGDKRVRSARLAARLPFPWRYPNHEAGLAAIVASDRESAAKRASDSAG